MQASGQTSRPCSSIMLRLPGEQMKGATNGAYDLQLLPLLSFPPSLLIVR